MTNSLEKTIVSPSQTSPSQTSPSQAISEPILAVESLVSQKLPAKISKDEIRSSLRASTLDGVFATIFSNITGGVLLSNFLVELQATPLQIGMLASTPMLANLLQPLGAYWSDRTTSRRVYGLWVYGISRLLWLPLAIGIIVFSWHPVHPQQMIVATLTVMLATHVMGALGSASWLSWLAALVPRQIRGRYFGFRNSTFSLTSFLALPLLGIAVSHWRGGSIQGFGVLVAVGVVAGLISLGFQSRMTDVNPQAYCSVIAKSETLQPALAPKPKESLPEVNLGDSLAQELGPQELSSQEIDSQETVSQEVDQATISQKPEPARSESISATKVLPETAHRSILNNSQFLLFLLYFGLWAFGLNLSNPFFNLYLLDNLALNLSWVTAYNALGAAANLLMLLIWGKLADRIGNRPILLFDGLVVAVIPLLWVSTDATPTSIWLWFPLLHLLGGGTGAAIDLCINNLQLAIAPVQHHTKYFALTAAIGGVAGAMGAIVGGWLAQFTDVGGMTGLFAFSSMLRLVALLPLVWLQEP